MNKYLVIAIFLPLIIEGLNDEPVKKFACPPGVREVNCFVDPCLNKVCPSDPTAKCIGNYCGGCNAFWLSSNGKQARCNKKIKSRCPANQKEFHCFRNPCQGEKCPGDSSAICITNYCGGCNFSWKKANGESARCK